MSQQDVFSHPVDQRSAPEIADRVAGHRPQQLGQRGQNDDDDQIEVMRLVRDLATRQHAPVDDRHLGPDGQSHGRDETEDEYGEVTPRFEKMLH